MAQLWDSPQLHARNQDVNTEIGGEGDAELAAGMIFEFGVEAHGEVTGKAHYEHTLLKQGDGESSTSITVEFGDCKHA